MNILKQNSTFGRLEVVLRDAISYLTQYHSIENLRRIAGELNKVFYVPHRIQEVRLVFKYFDCKIF